MPKLTQATPKYRKHRASGQAIVTLDGKDFYLGPHGTKASRLEYDRLVTQWLQNGRRLPRRAGGDTTVVELCLAYWKYARSYYVKDGRPTDELASIRVSLRFLRELYGNTLAAEFGPLALKAVRQKMIEADGSRGYINKNVIRIRRAFRWAVENELAPAEVLQGLESVAGLKRGRCAARENPPVLPVPDDDVERTILELPRTVADMVQLQRLTGCRPGEICALRPMDLDRAQQTWVYVPESHKMEHLGRPRAIFLGPRAQLIVTPYLLRGNEEYCFQPSRRTREGRYTTSCYRRAIHRAAERSGVQIWSPNQLRHSAATEIRRKFGLEGAQVALGHKHAQVTQLYAERDMAKAAEIMQQIG